MREKTKRLHPWRWVLCLWLLALCPQARGFVYQGLTYEANSDGATLTGYDGAAPTGEVTIPDKVTDDSGNTLSVTEIGERALSPNLNEITKITVPSTVKRTGWWPFSDNTGLVEVTLPAGIEMTGGTISGCQALRTVNVIGTEQPSEEWLNKLEVEPSAASIYLKPSYTATTATPLRTIVDDYLYSRNDNGVTLMRATVDLTGAVTIPDKVTLGGQQYAVTEISNNALSGQGNITSVTVPASVTKIGYDAFRSCTALTSATLPATTTLEYGIFQGGTFYNCNALTRVDVVGNTAPNDYWLNSLSARAEANVWLRPTAGASTGTLLLGQAEGALYMRVNNLLTLTSYRGTATTLNVGQMTIDGIATQVQAIANRAFSGNSHLTTVTLGSSVTKIGSNAFEYCSALTTATLPAALEGVDNGTFEGCGNLAMVKLIGAAAPKWHTEIPLPSDVVLYATSSATSGLSLRPIVNGIRYLLTLDETLTAIGYTSALPAALTMPATVALNGQDYPVREIKAETFSGCRTLTSVTLPATLRSVGDEAFYGCAALANATVAGRTAMGSNVFGGCGALTHIRINSTAAPSWWRGLSSNASVYLYDEATSTTGTALRVASGGVLYEAGANGLAAAGVANVSQLTTPLTLPETVQHECGTAKMSTVNDNAFEGYALGSTLSIPEHIKSLGSRSFAGSASLEEVTVYSSTAVSYDAFADCPKLQVVKVIGTELPEWARGLSAGSADVRLCSTATDAGTSIYLEAGGLLYSINGEGENATASIKGYTGAGPTTLTVSGSVTLEGKEYRVAAIDEGAFLGCDALTTVSINSSDDIYLFYVSQSAFADCQALTTMTLTGNVYLYSALNNNPQLSEVVYVGDEVTYWMQDLDVPSGTAVLLSPSAGSSSKTLIKGTVDGLTYKDGRLTGYTTLPADGKLTIRGGTFTSQEGYTVNCETIGYNAFRYIDDLTEVTVGEGITELGSYTFESCYNLRKVSLAESVAQVSCGTFMSCDNLEELTLYAGTALDCNPFGYRSNTHRVNIIGTAVPEWAYKFMSEYEVWLYSTADDADPQRVDFSATSGEFEFEIRNGGLMLTGYTGSAPQGKVTVPATATVNGQELPVTGIDWQSFDNVREQLTELTLPAGAKWNSLYNSFERLTTVKLVGDEAASLNQNYIGSIPQAEVTLVATADATEGERVVTTQDGLRYYIEGGEATLMDIRTQQRKEASIPTSLSLDGKTVPVTDYYYSALNNLDSDATVHFIGTEVPEWAAAIPLSYTVELCSDAALTECRSLRWTDGGLRYMASGANTATITGHEGNLTAPVTLPTSVSHNGDVYEVDGVSDYYIRDAATVRLIGSATPDWYTGLRGTVLLLPTATATGGTVLRHSADGISYGQGELGLTITSWPSNKSTLELPGSVQIEGQTYPVKAVDGHNDYFTSNSTTNLVIGEGIESIGNGAFQDMRNLETVKLPSTLRSLGSEAFRGEEKLRSVELPANLAYIGTEAFRDCQNLATITASAEGKNFFNDNSPFINYTGSNATLELLGTAAPAWLNDVSTQFQNVWLYRDADDATGTPLRMTVGGCRYAYNGSGLTLMGMEQAPMGDITVGGTLRMGGKDYTVNALGDNAIPSGQVPIDITVGDQVTSIGQYAFPSNTRHLTLPAAATTSNSTFDYLRTTELITLLGEAAPSWLAQLPTSGNIVLKHAAGSTEDLQFAEGDYRYRLLPAGASIVGRNGSTEPSGTVTLPTQVTHQGTSHDVVGVGNSVFSDCKDVKAVTIPDGVTSLGSLAFYGTGLSDVLLPKSVRTVDYNAFHGCKDLTRIRIVGRRMPDYVSNLPTNCEIVLVSDATQTEGEAQQFVVDNLIYRRNGTGVTLVGVQEWPAGPHSLTVPTKITYQGAQFPVTAQDMRNNQEVEAVTFAEGTRSISAHAFEYCYGLSSVTLPSTLESIGEQAFYYNRALTSVSIPQSVKSIGEQAFYGSALNDVLLHGDLKSVGDKAFLYYFYGFIRIVADEWPLWVEQLTDEEYSHTEPLLVASATATEGESYSSRFTVGDWTFRPAPGGLKATEYNGSSKATIELPASVTVNGKQRKVVGMDDLSLGGKCKTLVLPASLTSIGNVTNNNSKLTTVKIVGEELPAWSKALPSGLSVVLSASASEEGEVVDRSDAPFAEGRLRYQITRKSPAEVKLLGLTASDYTTVDLTLPATVRHAGADYALTGLGSNALKDYQALTSLTVPSGVRTLEANALSFLSNLESVSLPTSLTSIGNQAFQGCTSLTSLSLPSSAQTVGSDLVSGCSKLDHIELVGAAAPEWWTEALPATVEVRLVEQAGASKWTTLQAQAADDYWYRRSGEGVELVSRGTQQPYGTMTLTAPISLEGTTYPLTAITADFGSCNLSEVRIVSPTMPTISTTTFPRDCKVTWVTDASQTEGTELNMHEEEASYQMLSPSSVALTAWEGSITGAVTLPGTLERGGKSYQVTELGAQLLQNCTALTSVTLPAGVTKLGASALAGCSALTSLTLPAGVTATGEALASGCFALTTVTLPDNLKSIDNEAFRGCSKLAHIAVSGSDNRSSSACDVTWPSALRSIGNASFESCEALSGSLTFADALGSIGSRSFASCTGLTALTINSSTQVGNDAFAGCTGLQKVTVRGPRGTDLAPWRALFDGSVEVVLEVTSALATIQTTDCTSISYYDLGGHRLVAPRRGVTIVVENGKARKMLVK